MAASYVEVLLLFFLRVMILYLPVSCLLRYIIVQKVVGLLVILIVLILINICLRLRNQNILMIWYLHILIIWILLIVNSYSVLLLVCIITSGIMFSICHVLHAIMSLQIFNHLILLVVHHFLVLVHSNLHFLLFVKILFNTYFINLIKINIII